MNTSNPNLLNFAGKRVMITGTTSGIGFATAIQFAQAGAHLMLVNRSKIEAELEADLKSKALNGVDFLTADLSDKSAIDKMWAEIKEEDLPEVLVNNAGIYPMKEYTEIDSEFYDKVIDVNLSSVFWMCQNFVAKRGNNGGAIVNTSSIEALLPTTPDLIPYSTAKAGVVAMTRAIAREYGAKGFRANVIMPGAVTTEETEKKKWEVIRSLNFELVRIGLQFQQRIPMGRMGKPEDVAKATLFLASDLASYITGVVLPVDGGFLSN